ncbi:MAG TPA: hypothetical protein VGL89_12930 [Candidatus Koribacter sp.]|jgi:hypothetical protein
MKRFIVFLIVLFAVQGFAQEKSKITVKGTEKNSGVVIVTVSEGKQSLELNCNEGFPQCAAPKAGEYWMVKLAKNHGVYECQNVDLYLTTDDPDSGNASAVGEYCLVEK